MSRPFPPVLARRAARRAGTVLLTLAVLFAAGCAQFPDAGPRHWHDKPTDNGPLTPPPRAPNERQDQTPNNPAPEPPAPGQPGNPDGCRDPDPLVVATCLDPVSAIAPLPDGSAALVAERASGQILQVEKAKQPKLITTVPVDAANGGLIGLVLSPSFDQDQLLYAYLGTPTDHRVVRVTYGGQVSPILTGIPPTGGNDAGALGIGPDGALLVATGTSGTAEAPGSLAGKILRIDTFGHPMPDNPTPGSPVYSTGLQSPGGLCTSPDSGAVWVTDRLAQRDVLYRVTPGQLLAPAWNWPDRPGVSGCVAMSGALGIAERGASALFVLQILTRSDQFTGTPVSALAGKYGRLSAATLGSERMIWLGTGNKGAGGPVASSDDRVIKLPFVQSGGPGAGPD